MHTELSTETTRTERTDDGIPVFTDAQTALLETRDLLGRKWNPILLYHLLDAGPMGFSALKDRTDGISSKMLSESLDDLEAAGLVTRAVVSDQPVRVEYAPTARGEALEPALSELIEWAVEFGDEAESDDGPDAGGGETPTGRDPAGEGA
jgi:DNA-binding HxlR family transcriptional regulator